MFHKNWSNYWQSTYKEQEILLIFSYFWVYQQLPKHIQSKSKYLPALYNLKLFPVCCHIFNCFIDPIDNLHWTSVFKKQPFKNQELVTLHLLELRYFTKLVVPIFCVPIYLVLMISFVYLKVPHITYPFL